MYTDVVRLPSIGFPFYTSHAMVVLPGSYCQTICIFVPRTFVENVCKIPVSTLENLPTVAEKVLIDPNELAFIRAVKFILVVIYRACFN